MSARQDLHVLGWLVALVGLAQVLPLMAAFLYQEPPEAFAASGGLALGSGTVLVVLTRGPGPRLRARDGIVIVGCGWPLACLFGALPYVFTGALGPVGAFFEAVAGFTTTAATVLRAELPLLPRSLLLWRALTQWLGGAAVVLFVVAVVPVLGVGGMRLFASALPGRVAEQIQPRVARTVRLLWYVYLGGTIAAGLALAAAGLHPFEAICHALAGIAGGGFSTRPRSIAAFHSAAVDWVMTVVMLVAGTSLLVQARVLTGRAGGIWRDGELRWYLGLVGGAAVVLAAVLALTGGVGVGDAIRLGAFQAASFASGSGYASADFVVWPPLAQLVLVLLMILGGMTGSTSGGVGSLRALLGLRALRVAFGRLLHARAVGVVKYGGRSVDEVTLEGLWGFLTAWVVMVVAAALLVTASGWQLDTAWSAALTTMSNVGPGLGDVGAFADFAGFGPALEGLLALCMLAGRLELFTLFVLLSPAYWRR